MSYRLRISDELYRLMQDKASKEGVSIEALTERYILGAIKFDERNDVGAASVAWSQLPQPNKRSLQLVVAEA